MMNFINFNQEYTVGNLTYKKYILYSGEDIERIKSEIVEDIKDEWENEFDDISDIYSSFDLDSISYDTNDIINEYIKSRNTELTSYRLLLSDEPYTDIRQAIDFYFEYLSIRQEDLNDIIYNTKFFFAGYYEDVNQLIGIVNKKALSYLMGFKEDYKISLSNHYIDKITKILAY